MKLKLSFISLLILFLFITQSLSTVTTDLTLDGWIKAKGPTIYPKNKLTEHVNGAAEIYYTYNINDVTVFEFQKPNGSSIAIDIYDMTLPEDAFGIYSFNRSGSKEFVPVGNEGIISSGQLDFWVDKFYIRVSAGINFKISTTEFISLGNQIVSALKAEKGEVPKLVKMLPKKGLVAGSQIYFHKQLILDNIAPEVNKQYDMHLSDKTDAVYAEYNFDSTIGKLIVVEYANKVDMRNAFLSQKDTEPIHIGMLKKYFILLINMKPEKEKALIAELSDNF
ncbi:MAG: DUF6599 family protein [bacterium]